ncbi:MAG: hypothetical protein QOI42_175, partial [Frankiaceae bacterium]|nr:hypothetical protein [Frankiaceae bacterium]
MAEAPTSVSTFVEVSTEAGQAGAGAATGGRAPSAVGGPFTVKLDGFEGPFDLLLG